MLLALVIMQANLELRLPANTAYLIHPGKAEVRKEGVEGWSASDTEILWGGHLAKTGLLTIRPEIEGASEEATYRLAVLGPKGVNSYASKGGSPEFSGIKVETPGWYRFTLKAEGSRGGFGDVRSLLMSGWPVEGAQFNLKERRNAASVHIRYPVPAEAEIEWMYNEVKAQTDPIHTFYMACGFNRGYFGMQVNGPKDRRVIFSVWDSGNEAVDRSKVQEDDKVKLLANGADVFADSFGNEGTGGHSHLKTLWKTEVRQKFLLHAERDGTGTIYTAYFFDPAKEEWGLIASFRAPKDGKLLQRPHSFVENFWDDNGYMKRAAEFGPAWIRTTDGKWTQLKTARFSHDQTGGVDRFDYDLKVSQGRFVLQNGGFEGASPKMGYEVELTSEAKPPAIDFKRLPKK